MPLDIAFAASARQWPDRLHRFVLDHGGGRIVGRVLAAEQIEALDGDVLLIDDVCSFLTPHLVHRLKRNGIEVVGVFAPEDGSHAKRRLLECGISDVIEADATPEEFLSKIDAAIVHRRTFVEDAVPETSVLTVGVTGATAGVGMTEVSVGLSLALSERASTCLVDLDQNWPSVAQRLSLPVHPNIRTVLDEVLHQSRHPQSGMHDYEGLRVIGGRADRRHGALIGKAEVLALMGWLAETTQVVVVDLGPLSQVSTGVARELNAIVLVGSPDPVGVGRMATVIDEFDTSHQSLVAVLNQVSRGAYRRSELLSELARSYPTLPVVTLPHDRAVADAAWNGRRVAGGRFERAMGPMADLIGQAAV